MPFDPRSEIALTLTAAYRSEELPSNLMLEVVPILTIYSEKTVVRMHEIVTTERVGMVLTSESALVAGERKTWRAIHLWRFESGHLTRFEAYGQTLVVMPPRLIAGV